MFQASIPERNAKDCFGYKFLTYSPVINCQSYQVTKIGMSVRAKTLLQMINVFHRLITSLDGIVEPYCLSVFVTKQQRIYFDHWSRRIAHVSFII